MPDAESGPAEANAAAATGVQAAKFAIHKIYVKDLSFETPNSPDVFRTEWKPNVELNLSNDARRLDNDVYEVVLVLTATVTVEGRTAYLVEVQQAGIFTVGGLDEAQVKPVLGSFCPNVLFPYARETVSDLVSRGGFPQLVLAPVNFDALYAQHLQKERAGGAGEVRADTA